MLKSELERSYLEGDLSIKVKTLIQNLRAIYRNILKVKTLADSAMDLSLETLQERQLYLQEQQDKAQSIKSHLDVIVTPELQTLDYFAENKWDTFIQMADAAELALITRINHLHNSRRRQSMSTSTPLNSPGPSRQHESPGQYLRLPRLELPSFDGTLSNWQNFYDLFKSAIDNHGALSNATKMQYLKSAVTGEAARVLSVLPVTDANYQVALNALKTRYENKRALITHHLHNLTNIQPFGNDALSKLRTLRDTLNVSVESLKLLRVETDTWGPILIHIVTQKMSPAIQREWEKSLTGVNEYPDLHRFNTFLNDQVRILENLELTKEGELRPTQIPKQRAAHNTGIKDSIKKCPYCAQQHPIFQCEDFKALSTKERYNAQREKELCANCLFPGHKRRDCRSKGSCRQCSEKHHTLLHYDRVPDKSSHVVNNEIEEQEEEEEDPPPDFPSDSENEENNIAPPTIGLHTTPEHAEVLLATALVTVHSPLGATAVARALIDGGAETSFVSETLVQTLRLPKTKTRVTISGLQGTTTGMVKHSTSLQISSVHDNRERYPLKAYVLQHITNYKPKKFTPKDYAELKKLRLADPEPSSKLRIDLLLGADILGQLRRAGFVRLQHSQVTAQDTSLGWILSGPTSKPKPTHSITVNHAACDVPSLLQRFWEIEEFQEQKPASQEDDNCEHIFNTTTTRDDKGRFCVRLPFKSDEAKERLGESKSIAVASWGSVSRRLNKLPERRQTYDAFMKEYVDLKHMEEIPSDDPDLTKYVFLPHHDVVRSDHLTTKLRVVFNASANTKSGVSLNDVLCAGPKLQNDISDVVTNWRRHPFVLKADITKMFRQILIHPDDTRYQCIVHSDPVANKLKFYKLLTVTYGTRPAPYLANRVIKEVVKQHGAEFPLAVEPLEKCIYVDDAFLGANTEERAREIQQQVDQALKKACLELRKWSANYDDLLPDVTVNTAEFYIEPKGEDNTTVLGIAWSPREDVFSIKVQPLDLKVVTKRTILSNTAKLYDPLGWLAPFTVKPKMIMQALWLAKRDWDDPDLPEKIIAEWKCICEELPTLRMINIPRFVGSGARTAVVKLLGFSDASKTAYAAAVYLRVEYPTGEVKSNLIQAKSKVAPVKTVSIPRLELCGAVLLAKLISHLKIAWLDRIDEVQCYTDSRIVLDWLAGHASQWHTFVANRVSFIQTTIPEVRWQHIPGKANPADLPSRGLKAQDLVDSTLWWQGPELADIEKEEPEAEKLAAEAAEVAREACHTVSVHAGIVSKLPDYLTKTSSTWPKLMRVIAYCFKYLEILHERSNSDQHDQQPHPLRAVYERRHVLQVERVPWRQQMLTIEQLKRAENHIYQVQQDLAFHSEIAALKRGHYVSRGSPLHQLYPFLDEENILRARTRMQHASLSWNHKHPIILPKDRLTSLLIKHHHMSTLHGGLQLTLARLREQYWIVHARCQVKQVISRCVKCVRHQGQPQAQLMASLPTERVNPSPPFTHVGVDYCGHFMMKHASGRGHQSHKVWVAIFVCFATRAVHLEIVDDYTTVSFISAFKCFVSRRGLPSSLWMDQGTNLQGACNELTKVYLALRRSPEWLNHLAMQNIEFHSIPPKGHHQGGIWEAAVKAFKFHFKRIIGNFIPAWDEMRTIICQIEACLNSRPLTPIMDLASEEPALTSGHFLIGRSLKAVPQHNYQEKGQTTLARWQICSQIVQTFWTRWRNEALCKYYPRYKWREIEESVKVGDIVLLIEKDFPPLDWGLAVVIATKPGRDGLVREVTVRTAKSELTRPITKLVKLPTDTSET